METANYSIVLTNGDKLIITKKQFDVISKSLLAKEQPPWILIGKNIVTSKSIMRISECGQWRNKNGEIDEDPLESSVEREWRQKNEQRKAGLS
jgi:hypothetical protein